MARAHEAGIEEASRPATDCGWIGGSARPARTKTVLERRVVLRRVVRLMTRRVGTSPHHMIRHVGTVGGEARSERRRRHETSASQGARW